jgi:hypothetical protein
MRPLILLFIVPIFCSYNADRYRHNSCIPARDCIGENVCYCSDKFDGWMNGGGEKTRQFGRDGAVCAKFGRDCECEDCGIWGLVNNVQCQESRCDDNDGTDVSGACYNTDNSKRPYETQYNCYRTKTPCDASICGYGTFLSGCKRVSAGSCLGCPSISEGYFWANRGVCEQTRCSTIGAGQFLGKACTATADTVIAECRTHPGNIGNLIKRPDGRSTYYCPGGGLVTPLPENSEPTTDFSNFVCIAGFYLNGASCLPCVPGSACMYGKEFVCPMHYYTSTFAMHNCILCSKPSDYIDGYPIRCGKGSTANVGCVSCGGCDYDPKRGLACVTEAYEMEGLPGLCEPLNMVGSVCT